MSKRPNEILRSGLGCVARIGAVGLIGLLASCMTPPVESPPVNPDIFQALPQDPLSPTPAPRPVSFDDLPGWDGADLMAPLQAFRRSCRRVMARDDTRAYSDRVAYAGSVGDWRSACAALSVAHDSESARRVFEALFTPLEVISGEGTPRFTGYFEPEIEARREPVFPFTHPVPGVPDDLERVNGAQLGLSPRETFAAQRLPDGTLRRYPARAEIALRQDKALGYAHPADVFFLQIQGSGRLNFEDGQSMRAAYAAHNGQPFRSTANHLLQTGQITRGEASMQGIRAWMDRVPRSVAQEAMNANPRFVFFRPLPIGDPSLGPDGAEGVPLTPLGSMAVDTDIHPLGVPFFVETRAPGLGGDWSGILVSQDTGGAIKGRVRGDIYYGTGAAAGERAGTQNASGRMWAFLPRAVAARLGLDAAS